MNRRSATLEENYQTAALTMMNHPKEREELQMSHNEAQRRGAMRRRVNSIQRRRIKIHHMNETCSFMNSCRN